VADEFVEDTGRLGLDVVIDGHRGDHDAQVRETTAIPNYGCSIGS
jgi:hypothetical protein